MSVRKVLPNNLVSAKKIESQAHKGYHTVDGALCHEDASMPSRRLVLPVQLRDQVLIVVLDSVAFFIPVIGIEKIPRYSVFHGILAVH